MSTTGLFADDARTWEKWKRSGKPLQVRELEVHALACLARAAEEVEWDLEAIPDQQFEGPNLCDAAVRWASECQITERKEGGKEQYSLVLGRW